LGALGEMSAPSLMSYLARHTMDDTSKFGAMRLPSISASWLKLKRGNSILWVSGIIGLTLFLSMVEPDNDSSVSAVSYASLMEIPKDAIPVVQVHSSFEKECPDYLRLHLYQARQYNEFVVLLGDSVCRDFCAKWGIHWVDVSVYASAVEDFDLHYLAPHSEDSVWKSAEQRASELRSFARWIILREYMMKTGLERVFSSDSDTLLFADMGKVYRSFFSQKSIVTMLAPPVTTVSFNFFSLEGISDWISFIKYHMGLEKVQTNDMEEMRIYAALAIPASEMECAWGRAPTGSPQCSQEMPYNRIPFFQGWTPRYQPASLAAPFANKTLIIDYNIGRTPPGYYENIGYGPEYPNTMKRIVWRRGLPHLYRQDLQRFVRTLALHFQGPKKGIMYNYVRSKRQGDSFDSLSALGSELGILFDECRCNSVECDGCKPEDHETLIDMLIRL